MIPGKKEDSYLSPTRGDLEKMSLNFRGPLSWITILKLDIKPLTSGASFCKMLRQCIHVGLLNPCHMREGKPLLLNILSIDLITRSVFALHFFRMTSLYKYTV